MNTVCYSKFLESKQLTTPIKSESIQSETDDEELIIEQELSFFKYVQSIKPRRKYFDTPYEKKQYIMEYTKKKKTELCKNFSLTGKCKFGNTCSFAHGEEELQNKTHLHSNYKTKPCKRYFKQGYCGYGIRCQYLHDELKNQSSKEHQKYLRDVYKKKNLNVPIPPSIDKNNKYIQLAQLRPNERLDVQRFYRMAQTFQKQNQLDQPDLLIQGPSCNRLSFFQQLGESNKSFLSDSPVSTRKNSQYL